MNAPVLEAPVHTGSRQRAHEFLSELPDDLSDCALTVRFPDRGIGTASFVDELVKEAARRHVQELRIENLSGGLCRVAAEAAEEFHLGDRFICE